MYLEMSTRFSHTRGTLLGDRKFSLMRGVQILLPQIKPEEQLHLLRSSQKCRHSRARATHPTRPMTTDWMLWSQATRTRGRAWTLGPRPS